jgi:hypothetical protein
MSLNRFVVTCALRAWKPGDREHPERHISISPGQKDLFTEQGIEHSEHFVKFIQCGSWYEAERHDFELATLREMVTHSS